jgi:hypothetical protein
MPLWLSFILLWAVGIAYGLLLLRANGGDVPWK